MYSIVIYSCNHTNVCDILTWCVGFPLSTVQGGSPIRVRLRRTEGSPCSKESSPRRVASATSLRISASWAPPYNIKRMWRNGRRSRLKICRRQLHVGSSPTIRTKYCTFFLINKQVFNRFFVADKQASAAPNCQLPSLNRKLPHTSSNHPPSGTPGPFRFYTFLFLRD